MPAPANSKTVVRPLRVEIQDPGIQDAKLERRCIHVQQRPSASRQREGSRFERGPPRRLALPRYSPSLECNYAFGFDVVAASRRLIGETSLRARTHARTEGMDALSERGGRMMARIEGWPPGGAAALSAGERIDSVRMLRGCMPYG